MTARRALTVMVSIALSACGARTSLVVGGPQAGSSTGGAASASATDAGSGGAQPSCTLDDLATWQVERYRDIGDYERFAVSVSGEPWVALKVKDGNIVLAKLGLDAHGIVFEERIEVPNSPVYPVALDMDDRRFVMLTTTGINWNGDAALWRIDRGGGPVVVAPVGDPPADPAYTIGSAIGVAGDDVAVAFARAIENQGKIELRDDALQVIDTLPIGDVSFTAVHVSPTALDIYAGADFRVRVEGGKLAKSPAADPAWQVIGGLEDLRVEIGDQIRLTDGDATWPADWPHTQISPPAVVRKDGARAAFSLETELTAVIGHVTPAGLEWLRIDSVPDAPGLGVGLFPVIEPGRLGLFYLGLEVPHPEQPLRYFGLVCR